jgi:hypothetical protein
VTLFDAKNPSPMWIGVDVLLMARGRGTRVIHV